MYESLIQRAEDIFARARELEPHERTGFIERACLDDEALRREVDGLLAAADESERYFDDLSDRLGIPRLLAQDSSDTSARATGVVAGQTLGHYTLQERIGSGGMGEVWRAERSDGRFEGQVAVKLLNRPGGGAALKRFGLEGRYLARLSHPNIARLLDAGLGPGDVPYLVLEYVDGTPIDRYCDERRLSIKARIQLFLDALAAVARAHAHLIVHRDIKPSNVLVTSDGTVKLLDFGIAKVVNEDAAEGPSDLTREIGPVLTPDFAAPEQLTGQTITTAADVYSLGLLLYVLLTGHQPRRSDGHSYAQLRAAATREPPGLAAALMAAQQAAKPPSQVAELRSAPVTDLLRALRGDVDNIVRKAMALDPMERYATVAEFAADLKRYLDNQPVTAQPQTIRYRVRKFVRRHRTGVLAGALVFIALMISTAITAWQSVEARRQRDAAVYQQQRVQASNEFLNLLLTEVGPAGKPLTMAELLDRGVAMLDRQYGAEPHFIGRMLLDLANGYFSLARHDRMLELLGRAERAARSNGDHDLLAAALCGQARLRYRDHPEAARAQVQAANQSQARTRVRSIDSFVSCARANAVVLESQGNRQAAIDTLLAARARLAANPVASLQERSYIANELANLYYRERRLDRAAELNDEILEYMQATGQSGTLGYLIISLNRASLLHLIGEVKNATDTRSALIARIRELEQSGQKVQGFGIGYATSLLRLSRYAEAVRVLEDEISTSVAAGNRADAAQSRMLLGSALANMKRFAEADARLDSAEAYFRTAAAVNDRQLRYIAIHRALLQFGRGDAPGARQTINEQLVKLGYPEHPGAPDLSFALRVATELAIETQDATAAERYATDYLAIAERIARDPRLSADVGQALLMRARARRMLGNAASARADLERALPSLTNGLGADHADTREAAQLLRF